jgi:hypothetical protein
MCSCCCGGCGSCCGSRKDRTKYKDDYSRMPQNPAPYTGYQPTPSPMAYGHNPAPQFATFDDPSSRKINEDSLPPMPSWDTASKRRIEEPTNAGELEMGRLETQPQRMRGGYNSVPNGPMSPNPMNSYSGHHNDTGMHQHQPYNADLGQQRLDDNPYDDFRSVPLSPPPTYRSHSQAPSVSSDKFMAGAASPSPGEYTRSTSYAPSSISTRYEPQREPRYPSQREPQQYAPYGHQQPPSFLQPGRRPVNGGLREV